MRCSIRPRNVMAARVLLLGTGPVDVVRAVARWWTANEPATDITLVVNDARIDLFAPAADLNVTIVGFAGGRIAVSNPSVMALIPRLRRARFDEIAIVVTNTTGRGFNHVVRVACTLGVAHDRIRLAYVAEGGRVTTVTVAQRRRDERKRRRDALITQWTGSVLNARGLCGIAVAAALFRYGAVGGWICLAVAHLITVCAQRASWGEYTGDAGIHLQLAKRTGMGEVFCFDPRQFSAGSSSPLWTLLLALLWRMGARRDLETAGKLLASAAAHAALVTLALAARAWLGPDSAWGLAPLVLSVLPQFHVWTCRAMEASSALLMGALIAFAALSHVPFPPALVAGLFALAFLARWENIALLAPMYLLAAMKAGPVVLLSFVPAAAIAALNWAHIGSPVASTAGSRRRAARVALNEAGRNPAPEAWRDLVSSKRSIASLAVIGMLATVFAPSPVTLALIAWLLLAATFFSVIVPTTYDERYLMPSLAPYVLLATAGADAAMRWTIAPLAALVIAAVIAARIAGVLRDLPLRRRAAERGHARERRFRQEIARALDAQLPPRGVVALIEVDVRWFMTRDDVRVVSLDAVLDGTVAPSVVSGRFSNLLVDRGVTHVLIEENLHLRAGWRDTDLFPLVGATGHVMIEPLGPLVPMAEWRYDNWGETPMRWVLWRVERAASRCVPNTCEVAA